MPRKRIAKGGGGVHLGAGRGASLDFYGHSPYTPGEDIRKIDWKAYARTENLYVKDFSEERQVLVRVLLDSSASMDFGSPGKWAFALKLSLGLACLALRQGDRLSFYTAGRSLEVLKESVAGTGHFYDLMKAAPLLRPGGATAQQAFTGAAPRGPGITFILSDFFGLDAAVVLDHFCLPDQQVAAIQVISPQELDPPAGEELKLVDAETGRIKRIHFTAAARRRYAEKAGLFLAATRERCVRRGASYILAITATDPVCVLKQALEVGE
ncbi:MAG: DUF58 domain-containing protein [Peptococcaceae bacterium]|nr:DUF58 domain-containing protein [Peptococcaceae bacterium]